MKPNPSHRLKRRQFLWRSALTGGSIIATNLFAKSGFSQTPGLITSDKMRPAIPYGVASGDINGNRAVIWSRSDRPARIIVEYATNETFKNVRRLVGSVAAANTDFTAQVNLNNLPSGQQIFYRVIFQDLANTNIYSAPVSGQLRTAPESDRDIFFAWSGDTAGQGWGINLEWGGMKIYETIRRLKPDFFISLPERPQQERSGVWGTAVATTEGTPATHCLMKGSSCETPLSLFLLRKNRERGS